MRNFDPSKHTEDTFNALPAGEYLIAMVSFERKTSQKGSEYIRAKYRVIFGKGKGRTFFSSVGIDVSNDGIAGRLGLYCKAVGVKKAFDLDSDAAFGAAFLGKPFKAVVKVTKNGQYTNNDVERYLDRLTPEETDAAEEFYSEFRASKAQDDESSGGWDEDEGGGAPPRGASGSGSRSSNFDDDIPF